MRKGVFLTGALARMGVVRMDMVRRSMWARGMWARRVRPETLRGVLARVCEPCVRASGSPLVRGASVMMGTARMGIVHGEEECVGKPQEVRG